MNVCRKTFHEILYTILYFTQSFPLLTCFRRLLLSYSKKKFYILCDDVLLDRVLLILWWKQLSLWNFIGSCPSSIRGTLRPRFRSVLQGDVSLEEEHISKGRKGREVTSVCILRYTYQRYMNFKDVFKIFWNKCYC